jgi:hypothetical protein
MRRIRGWKKKKKEHPVQFSGKSDKTATVNIISGRLTSRPPLTHNRSTVSRAVAWIFLKPQTGADLWFRKGFFWPPSFQLPVTYTSLPQAQSTIPTRTVRIDSVHRAQRFPILEPLPRYEAISGSKSTALRPSRSTPGTHWIWGWVDTTSDAFLPAPAGSYFRTTPAS